MISTLYMAHFVYVHYHLFTPLTRLVVRKLINDKIPHNVFSDEKIPKNLYKDKENVIAVYPDKSFESKADGSKDPVFIVLFDFDTPPSKRTDFIENLISTE